MIAALGAYLAKSMLMQSPVGGILKAVPRWAWIALAVAIALLLAVRWHGHQVKQLRDESFAAGVALEHQAHLQTIANYRAAAERARQLDAANAARVRAEQSTINQETKDAFEKRLADARARADRLRRAGAAAANPGGRAAAPVPGLPAAPGRIAQGAGEDGFPLEDRLTATEQAIQLDELINWVRRQAAVDVNGKPEK